MDFGPDFAVALFFRRRVADEANARRAARAILKQIELVPLNQAVLEGALVAAGSDFEDNIQIASAELITASHLITRNKKDFFASPVAVLVPEEWLVLPEVSAVEATLARSEQ